MDAWTLIGLIGVALFISAGEVIEPLRDWLCGFSVRYNPLLVIGRSLSSALCTGFFVGVMWDGSLVTAGVVALSASVSSELLGLTYGLVFRVTATRPAPPPAPRPAKLQRRDPPPDTLVVGEEEAHRIMDERERLEG